MNNSDLVGIIVPAFNGEKTIEETLNSVIEQTYEKWVCIVINDGSTDNTANIVNKYIDKDNRFKLISIENNGVSNARNIGIANSGNCKYIFPLDADNYLAPQCIEKLVNEFENNSNLKLVYSEVMLFGNKSGCWNLPPYSYKKLLQYCMIDNSAMFLKEDFLRVGGYRTNMVNGLEDWDFLIALLAPYNNNQVCKVNEPLYYYRTQENSRGQNVIRDGKFSDMLDLIVYNNYPIYRKYYPDIFNRITKYDYLKNTMNKQPFKYLAKVANFISKLKH